MRSVYCWVQIRLDTIAHLLHWPKKTMMIAITLWKYCTHFHTYIFLISLLRCLFSFTFSDFGKNKLKKLLENREKLYQLLSNFLLVLSDHYGWQNPSFQKIICFIWDFSHLSSHMQFWSCILKKSNSILGKCSKHIFVIELMEFWSYRYRCFSPGGVSTKLSCFNFIQTLKFSWSWWWRMAHFFSPAHALIW